MAKDNPLRDRRRLLAVVAALLALGFGASSVMGYLAAREALISSIADRELPATSEIVNERIQKDLVRPLFVSSMMANDSFLHAWAEAGEKDLGAIDRYLGQIQARYGAFTTFFVSEATGNYYHPGGVLKKLSHAEPRDAWYFRVREMEQPYELNVDPDLAHADALTVFINYRVVDASGKYLGATGVGVSIDLLSRVSGDFRRQFGTYVYFVDGGGKIVAGSPALSGTGAFASVSEDPALATVRPRKEPGADQGYAIERGGAGILLDARYIPELGWFLYAEKPEDEAVAGPRRALAFSTALSLLVLALALAAILGTLRRFQARLVEAASRDALTGCLNRRAFGLVVEHALRKAARDGAAVSVAMLDLDDFKLLNDEEGHLAGDEALARVSALIASSLRASDALCRWGGEEFLALLPGCSAGEAAMVAEKILAVVRSAAPAGPRPLTLSIGVAELGRGEDFDSLLRRADEALYRAKEAGKDRVAAAR